VQPEVFATQPSRSNEQQQITELERMVGRLTMQLEAAKEASNILLSLDQERQVIEMLSQDYPETQSKTCGIEPCCHAPK
jgi:hypothetical protein